MTERIVRAETRIETLEKNYNTMTNAIDVLSKKIDNLTVRILVLVSFAAGAGATIGQPILSAIFKILGG